MLLADTFNFVDLAATGGGALIHPCSDWPRNFGPILSSGVRGARMCPSSRFVRVAFRLTAKVVCWRMLAAAWSLLAAARVGQTDESCCCVGKSRDSRNVPRVKKICPQDGPAHPHSFAFAVRQVWSPPFSAVIIVVDAVVSSGTFDWSDE